MPQHTPASRSPYYPPRAGGSRTPRRFIGSMRAALHLERIHLPPLRGLWRILASAVVPGLVFHFNGPRIVARIIWGGLPVLFLVFLAGLGTFFAEAAFALMIGAHVASVSHLLRPLTIRVGLLLQLVFGVVFFVALSGLFYMPARGWFHAHVAMPLEVEGQMIVMNPWAERAEIRRGDRVLYRVHASSRQAVVLRAGMNFLPVSGLPGDLVVFGDGVAWINGQPHSLPGCAREWEAIVVPEECWFIWPDLDIINRGVAAASVANMLRRLAVVPNTDYVGRPYPWWFFRGQGSE